MHASDSQFDECHTHCSMSTSTEVFQSVSGRGVLQRDLVTEILLLARKSLGSTRGKHNGSVSRTFSNQLELGNACAMITFLCLNDD